MLQEYYMDKDHAIWTIFLHQAAMTTCVRCMLQFTTYPLLVVDYYKQKRSTEGCSKLNI